MRRAIEDEDTRKEKSNQRDNAKRKKQERRVARNSKRNYE